MKSQNLKKAFYNFRLFPIADSCAVLWFVKGSVKGQGLARMIVRRCNGRKLDGPWFTFCKECFDAMYHIIKLLHFLFYRQDVLCIYCVFLHNVSKAYDISLLQLLLSTFLKNSVFSYFYWLKNSKTAISALYISTFLPYKSSSCTPNYSRILIIEAAEAICFFD